MKRRRPSCARPSLSIRIARNAVSSWQIFSVPGRTIVLQSKRSWRLRPRCRIRRRSQFGLASLYLKTGQEAKAREQYAVLTKDYKEKPVRSRSQSQTGGDGSCLRQTGGGRTTSARGLEGESSFVRGADSLRSDGLSQEEWKRCGPGVSNRIA